MYRPDGSVEFTKERNPEKNNFVVNESVDGLEYGTKYTWEVEAWNDKGTVNGGRWSFETKIREEAFLRGDCDGDGSLGLNDVIQFLNYQFVGSIDSLSCLDAADVDDSGVLELTDAIRSLNFQFLGIGEVPEPPGPYNCGPDPTPDDGLSCEEFPRC